MAQVAVLAAAVVVAAATVPRDVLSSLHQI